jgi:glycerophosphoryl diester phosphodiesterase
MPNYTKTLCVAHRGARSLAPENTLAAAQKALEIGADMWELDVGMTADGELVLRHDNTLERVSNVAQVFPERRKWWGHQFTLAELRQLDFGSWFNDTDPFGQIAAGNVAEADLKRYVGEPIPTLQEALAFVLDNDWRVNIEIKNWMTTPGDPVIVEEVVALIERMDMIDRVLISSFNFSYLERVRAACARIARGVLVLFDVFDPVALLRQLDAQAYHPRETFIQPEVVPQVREQGFEVYVWTVNDEALMRTLAEAGASGIMSDFPQRLRQVLDSLQ